MLKSPELREMSLFALRNLAQDVVVDIIKAGGFQKLKDGHFKDQHAKEWVAFTLKRLEQKIQGRVLKHLIYLMCFAGKGFKDV
ncbi:ARM repeat protein interacting with ABF2 [Spatholobus suberectus]|nr:ARM repeat protein interacting with ABF2 [Spatholobus suberectus]